MHCASLLRTILALLAHANERVHVQNENFPQAMLDTEMNVPFLLNELGDLYFLSHNSSVHILLFNLKKIEKNFIGQKKDIGESAQKNSENNVYTNA